MADPIPTPELKTFKQILNGMVVWIAGHSSITNFKIGSVTRTLLEGVAKEIESLYMQSYKFFRYAIENAIYDSFNLPRSQSIHATGKVLLTFVSALLYPLVIPSGFRFCTLPSYTDSIIYFETTQEVTILTGSTSALIDVQCVEPGIIGNVPAGSIVSSPVIISVVQSITNSDAFYTGSEEETTDQLKNRFSQYIGSLSKGTLGALYYCCSSVSGIAGIKVEELVGYVRIYLHDANGELPDALRQNVITALNDYKTAGMRVDILKATKHPVSIDISVTLYPDFDTSVYSTLIKNAVETHLNGFSISQSLILTELISYIRNIDISAIYDVSLNLSSNVSVLNSELIRPEVITVTCTSS